MKRYLNKSNVFLITLSILFSLLLTIGNYNAYMDINVTKISLILSNVVYTIIFFLILKFLAKKNLNVNFLNSGKKREKSFKFFLATFTICIICWIPYFLSMYPAIFTRDTFEQFEQAIGAASYNNHHPVVMTLVIKFFCKISRMFTEDYRVGLGMYIIAQMIFLAVVFSYVVHYFYTKGAPKIYLCLSILFYAFFYANRAYSVTMWKDIPLGAIVLIFSLVLWKIEQDEDTTLTWVSFFIFGELMCLLKNNAFYAYVLCVPFIILFIKKRRVLVTSLSVLTVVISMLVKGPIMDSVGVVPVDTIEGLSIPAQHIARAITDGYELTDDERELLSKVVDVDQIPEVYQSWLSDPIKNLVRETDNQEYIEEHKKEFAKVWLDIGLRQPGSYLLAQIDQTRGFWCPEVVYWVTATQFYDNIYVDRKPIVNLLTEESLENIETINKSVPILRVFSRIATFSWIALAMFWISIYKKQKILCFFPALAILASLMIATPVYAEFRYAYPLVITIPLLIAVGCSKNKAEEAVTD